MPNILLNNRKKISFFMKKNKYPQTVKCGGEIMLKKLKTLPKNW